jgi:serine phosphatase RsbU (regulator of sigma subunit)
VGTSISELREGFVARWQHLEQERIERERVEHELRVAWRIQHASLPKEVPTLEGWQISPYYRPAREVGGDFYAILDPKSASLSYANAGHDLPYLRRSGGYAEELRARGMPLGLMSGMSYEEGEASLTEGDSVLFYSDGLVEAHDPEGEMFGFPRLRALVAEHAEQERPLGDFLMEELYSFVGESWEQEDDITLLTLKRPASLS